MLLLLKIRLYGEPYSICYITEEDCVLTDEDLCKDLGLQAASCSSEIIEHHENQSKCHNLVTNALFLKPFMRECLGSQIYRTRVLENLRNLSGHTGNGLIYLRLKLEPPDKEILDYAWNERMLRLIWTRVEIENAFSWLSTLGGAYSALGDYFENCINMSEVELLEMLEQFLSFKAEEAGRISVRQYKLSLMLGDEGLAARSKLYSALSSAQKGNLKLSRHIVRKVAEFAQLTHDRRLMRMCHGVWAKLKYLRGLKKQLDLREDGDKSF